jgi:hypothetical protein
LISPQAPQDATRRNKHGKSLLRSVPPGTRQAQSKMLLP